MPAKPSPDQLRVATDARVLRELIAHGRLTRAELAVVVGISKPTSSESVRRLTAAGLVVRTGARSAGPGRAGDYYALAPDLPAALAVSIGPAGLVAEVVDLSGRIVRRREEELDRPAHPAVVSRVLGRLAAEAARAASGGLAAATVSAADPVDRRTGRLVHLPGAPFLLGELSPVPALGRLVDGPILVDNDVNWAAMAERSSGVAQHLDDFVYLYLGEGLGAALVLDGHVRRGHGGLAGEVAQLLTVGPQRRATPLIDAVAVEGLRRPGSTALDVDATAALLDSPSRHAAAQLRALVGALAGAIATVVALVDPEAVVVGGPWGTHPRLLDTLAAELAAQPRRVQLRPAGVTAEPGLAGARDHAVAALRDAVVTAVTRPRLGAGGRRGVAGAAAPPADGAAGA